MEYIQSHQSLRGINIGRVTATGKQPTLLEQRSLAPFAKLLFSINPSNEVNKTYTTHGQLVIASHFNAIIEPRGYVLSLDTTCTMAPFMKHSMNITHVLGLHIENVDLPIKETQYKIVEQWVEQQSSIKNVDICTCDGKGLLVLEFSDHTINKELHALITHAIQHSLSCVDFANSTVYRTLIDANFCHATAALFELCYILCLPDTIQRHSTLQRLSDQMTIPTSENDTQAASDTFTKDEQDNAMNALEQLSEICMSDTPLLDMMAHISYVNDTTRYACIPHIVNTYGSMLVEHGVGDQHIINDEIFSTHRIQNDTDWSQIKNDVLPETTTYAVYYNTMTPVSCIRNGGLLKCTDTVTLWKQLVPHEPINSIGWELTTTHIPQCIDPSTFQTYTIIKHIASC